MNREIERLQNGVSLQQNVCRFVEEYSDGHVGFRVDRSIKRRQSLMISI